MALTPLYGCTYARSNQTTFDIEVVYGQTYVSPHAFGPFSQYTFRFSEHLGTPFPRKPPWPGAEVASASHHVTEIILPADAVYEISFNLHFHVGRTSEINAWDAGTLPVHILHNGSAISIYTLSVAAGGGASSFFAAPLGEAGSPGTVIRINGQVGDTVALQFTDLINVYSLSHPENPSGLIWLNAVLQAIWLIEDDEPPPPPPPPPPPIEEEAFQRRNQVGLMG